MTMIDNELFFLRQLMKRYNVAWSSGSVVVSGLLPDKLDECPFKDGWPCVILAERKDDDGVVVQYLVSPLRDEFFISSCWRCVFVDRMFKSPFCQPCVAVRDFRYRFWVSSVGCRVVSPDGVTLKLYV